MQFKEWSPLGIPVKNGYIFTTQHDVRVDTVEATFFTTAAPNVVLRRFRNPSTSPIGIVGMINTLVVDVDLFATKRSIEEAVELHEESVSHTTGHI
jgi:hypothetical protein